MISEELTGWIKEIDLKEGNKSGNIVKKLPSWKQSSILGLMTELSLDNQVHIIEWLKIIGPLSNIEFLKMGEKEVSVNFHKGRLY